jgi:hypothetical protein
MSRPAEDLVEYRAVYHVSDQATPGAIAASREACRCTSDHDADEYKYRKSSPEWQSCLEYWGVECLGEWCRWCQDAIAIVATSAESGPACAGSGAQPRPGPLFRCADPACPGRRWRASDRPHPAPCGASIPDTEPTP